MSKPHSWRAATVVVAGAIAFSSAATGYPAESCGISERIWPGGFEAGDMPAAFLPSPSTPLALTIDPGLINLTTELSRVAIFGTYSGPPNTGVSDGSSPALTDSGRFLLSPAELALGANSFNIVATTVDGATVARTLTITRVAPTRLQPRFVADDAAVFAPGFARFRIVVPDGLVVTALAIDFDDDGNSDIQGLGALDGVRARYPVPGFFSARATISWDDGDPVTPIETVVSRAPLLLRHSDVQRLTLCDTWFAMRQRLLANDLEGASMRLMPVFRNEALAAWTGLGPELPNVVNQLGLVIDGTLGPAVAELSVGRQRATPTDWIAFPVQFELGRDGVWRISGM